MFLERPGLEWSAFVVPIVAVTAVAGLILGGLAPKSGSTGNLDRLAIVARPAPALPQRLAAMDAALGRMDLGQARHEWREAYGLALRGRRWDAMAAVGDAAVRADALARGPLGHPTGFQPEARQAYLRALFQAHREGSREGVTRIADSFAVLGDADVAAHVRGMVVAR